MSESSRFLLDANTFIQAKNDYYRFAVCPGYWNAILAMHKSGRVLCLDRIRDELAERKDDLSDWVKDVAPKSFFAASRDPDVQEAYGRIIAWVNSVERYYDAAKATFAASADGWLIAYALVHDLIVVTHEQPAPDSRNRVKIPDVCLEFDIRSKRTFDMLEELRARFVLEK